MIYFTFAKLSHRKRVRRKFSVTLNSLGNWISPLSSRRSITPFPKPHVYKLARLCPFSAPFRARSFIKKLRECFESAPGRIDSPIPLKDGIERDDERTREGPKEARRSLRLGHREGGRGGGENGLFPFRYSYIFVERRYFNLRYPLISRHRIPLPRDGAMVSLAASDSLLPRSKNEKRRRSGDIFL